MIKHFRKFFRNSSSAAAQGLSRRDIEHLQYKLGRDLQHWLMQDFSPLERANIVALAYRNGRTEIRQIQDAEHRRRLLAIYDKDILHMGSNYYFRAGVGRYLGLSPEEYENYRQEAIRHLNAAMERIRQARLGSQ